MPVSLTPPRHLASSRCHHTDPAKAPRPLSSFISSYSVQPDHFDEDHVIGDCVVFEEGVFDDPCLQKYRFSPKKAKPRRDVSEIGSENLVSDQWQEVQENEGDGVKSSDRVATKNPRWAVYGKGLEDVAEFFNSGNYEPGVKKSEVKDPPGWRHLVALCRRNSFQDGWTWLHLAVQGRRTDVVRLLLIKGADKTLKNKDGLTPLDLCLYTDQDTRTYELIKLLKLLPKPH